MNNNNNNNQTLHLKRDVLARLIQAFLSDDFESNVNKIPYEMRPKNKEVSYRCCIHKERAILKERTLANLGVAIENSDEAKQISDYVDESLNRQKSEENVLTVLDTACQGCTTSSIYVTDLCQGCVARPCIGSCNFGAISMKNGKSVIDGEKCKNCTKCIQVCPYNAIAKIRVPCEESCSVNAIKKNSSGFAEIDFDKCIYCGSCLTACPFGAVAEKSQIVNILQAIKLGKNVVAMVAPSIVGQLPVSINKLASGLIQVGFSEVYEVAQGADITARNEAVDFRERMQDGDKFMTTSCCAAYNNLVEKHISEIKPFVSETMTPLHYTGKIAKEGHPDCISVFIGPCVAKRKEGLADKYTDFVMSFEEMGALFVALRIELSRCDDYVFKTESSNQGRNFAVTGGVAQSLIVASGNESKVKPVCINGLDKSSIRELRKYANLKECADGNLVEVMACLGGCVAGSSTLNASKMSKRVIDEYSLEGKDLQS